MAYASSQTSDTKWQHSADLEPEKRVFSAVIRKIKSNIEGKRVADNDFDCYRQVRINSADDSDGSIKEVKRRVEAELHEFLSSEKIDRRAISVTLFMPIGNSGGRDSTGIRNFG